MQDTDFWAKSPWTLPPQKVPAIAQHIWIGLIVMPAQDNVDTVTVITLLSFFAAITSTAPLLRILEQVALCPLVLQDLPFRCYQEVMSCKVLHVNFILLSIHSISARVNTPAAESAGRLSHSRLSGILPTCLVSQERFWTSQNDRNMELRQRPQGVKFINIDA